MSLEELKTKVALLEQNADTGNIIHSKLEKSIEKLTELLEKQRLMNTRISLSKDPEAIELKQHLEQSVQLLGFPEGTDMSLLFSGMSSTIDNLKTQLD